eukprot:CAMPEP_0168348188 /NCGR_PEP_ID=MMETSP0213-20121227/19536_1 /TAXON_ID=151035 /ORGANISM="Euplotes harpa, Strain FSP1.4" /LENGTH=48 /DNA_ID= /DNA_START= /DNA_END= /DNA_ORIENTATION=
MICQQFSGVNVIYDYSTGILVGGSKSRVTLKAIIGLTNMLVTFGSLYV